jgi:hypothetical protein
MAVGVAAARADSSDARLARTAALLEERGYAVSADRLAALCVGGQVTLADVKLAAATGALELRDGLALRRGARLATERIAERAHRHRVESIAYRVETERFAAALVRWLPFVRSVALAGSLASGGFVETDDVDLNLVVADGRRHTAYAVVNLLGMIHALRHRGKPVDASSARPVAPRVMTVNLVVEEGRAGPFARTDPQMALELLLSQPLAGRAVARRIALANPALLAHFPQLAARDGEAVAEPPARLPAWLFPAPLDQVARVAGLAAWSWLQWTRRRQPEALARVAYVRTTMRPYTLFDRGQP